MYMLQSYQLLQKELQSPVLGHGQMAAFNLTDYFLLISLSGYLSSSLLLPKILSSDPSSFAPNSFPRLLSTPILYTVVKYTKQNLPSLSLLSILFNRVEYIHTVIQQISRMFSACKMETLHLLIIPHYFLSQTPGDQCSRSHCCESEYSRNVT
jgi:hypothetical protein